MRLVALPSNSINTCILSTGGIERGNMTSKHLVLNVIIMLFMIMCCNISFADTWYSDNFDSYGTGNLSGKGSWICSPTSSVRVITSYSGQSKPIRASYPSYGVGEATHTLASGTGGYHYIDFKAALNTVAPPSTPLGEDLGYVALFDASNHEITRFYYSHRQFKVNVGTVGKVLVWDNVPVGAWFDIRLGINLYTGKMDVWVNKVRKVTGADTLYPSATSIGKISFGQIAGLDTKFTTSDTYLDNLECNSVVLPVGAAKRILSPRLFPTWQFQNVTYPCVIYDGNYKMFYSGSGAAYTNESVWDQWATGMVSSPDSMTWTFPDTYEAVLYPHKYGEGGLVDPDEASAEFDSIFAIGACVIKDGSTYKMWYTGWNGNTVHLGQGLTEKINHRIGYATSPDAINWTRYAGSAGAGSIFAPTADQESKNVAHPHVLKETDGTYHMWYEGQGDDNTWRIFYATSSDGINWTRHGVAVDTRKNGSYDAVGTRNPVVVKRNGKYEMWYEGTGDSPTRKCHALKATSTDGLNWTKVFGEVALHPDTTIIGNERFFVDSVIVLPDNRCQVFFAKENTSIWASISRGSFNIYMEVMN